MDNRRSYLLAYGILAIAIVAIIVFLIFGVRSAQAPGASQNPATSA